ncbi:unnamed protein product [Caenorhabditis auriculariae]|uniref:(3R)-3-hydroxyacyl-CoA dehydrogenase n=1 Tax=Caenorhabditis auriculariae TaxID=2777116 RepID=A0A8S1H4B9_9PELO|nr:unnamed protein product [Caenorhabditis auriculariae]
MTSSLLTSKLAVVTGGGSGIGKAVCHALASQGARVIIADLQVKSAEETLKEIGAEGNAAFACDVSKEESVKSLKDFAITKLGSSPSILVNCAGITKDSTLLKMPKASWDAVIGVNLTGIYLITQAFARASVESEKPLSVVNVSSIVGKVGNFGQTNYAATKAGVIGFTKSAAKELAQKGIRVNAILPGFIQTPMTAAMPEQVGIPMGRMGEAKEIADGVVFFASDLSSYITGTTLEITGGLHM